MITYPRIGIIYAAAQFVFNTLFIPRTLRGEEEGKLFYLSAVLEINLLISLCFSADVK